MDATQTTGFQHAPFVMQSASQRVPQAICSESTYELVAALKKFARHGTRVENAGSTMSGQVRVDVVVSSPSDRIGVICDQADSRKIHRQRSLLNDLFVDRVYLTSQLDAMIDPLAVARGIARREPDLFAMPGESRDASALGSRVGVVRSLRTAPNQPPLRLDRPLEREWPGEATRPVQAA